MIRVTCPCCGRTDVALVRDAILETHYRPNGTSGHGAGPHRAGPYCNGSGYTVEQAKRWSALSPEERQRRVDGPYIEVQ